MHNIRPRDVIKIFDTQLRAANWKRLICVCERRRLFLRINSRPFWTPHIQVRQIDAPEFLDWDSYVELRELVRIFSPELREALIRADNPIGRVSQKIARQIAFAAQTAPTLSDERRAIVWEGLVGSE